MHIARWRCIRRMKISMRIKPDHAQFTFWPGHFDPGYRGSRYGMITTEYDREKIIFYAVRYRFAHLVKNGHNSFDALGIWRFNWFIEQFVFSRYFLRWKMNEKIAHKI